METGGVRRAPPALELTVDARELRAPHRWRALAIALSRDGNDSITVR
jgi:hypothetical protein